MALYRADFLGADATCDDNTQAQTKGEAGAAYVVEHVACGLESLVVFG